MEALVGREVSSRKSLGMRSDHHTICASFGQTTCHTQSYCVDSFLEGFSLRHESHCDGGKGLTTHDRGGNVIASHIAFGRVRQPGERHRSCQLHFRAPTGTAIDRGDAPSIQLAGRVCTVGKGDYSPLRTSVTSSQLTAFM